MSVFVYGNGRIWLEVLITCHVLTCEASEMPGIHCDYRMSVDTVYVVG